MATFLVVYEFGNKVADEVHDLAADTFKAVLTNTAPTQAGSAVLADITQIANGNGYTTGGVTLSGVTFAETGAGTGIWEFDSSPFSWTASGGSIATFRYVVVYNDTAANDELVGYADYGSAVNVSDGTSFTVTPGANGIFRITVS